MALALAVSVLVACNDAVPPSAGPGRDASGSPDAAAGFDATADLLSVDAEIRDDGLARVPPEFGAFHFTIDDRSASDQIDLLRRLGFSGMMIVWRGGEDFAAYAQHVSVRDGSFKIFAALAAFDDSAALDEASVRAMTRELAKTRTALWVMIAGRKDIELMAKAAAAVADLAGEAGVNAVLYPHDGLALEEVSESLDVLARAKRQNLSTSLHLCHEFKAAKHERLEQTIGSSVSQLGLASIHGTYADAHLVEGWSRGIVPLDEGDFDVQRRYLGPLLASGYRGPILLHTFGIEGAPEEHLARSMRKWKAMLSELGW